MCKIFAWDRSAGDDGATKTFPWVPVARVCFIAMVVLLQQFEKFKLRHHLDHLHSWPLSRPSIWPSRPARPSGVGAGSDRRLGTNFTQVPHTCSGPKNCQARPHIKLQLLQRSTKKIKLRKVANLKRACILDILEVFHEGSVLEPPQVPDTFPIATEKCKI